MTIVLDGPMGTELARRGVPTQGESWSATALRIAPDVVGAIHNDYAIAGATVHTANTFRTKRRTLGADWESLVGRAVQIARASVPKDHRVAGSIAPVRDCYRPDLSPGAAAFEEHLELARALATAGVDLILCETFPQPEEAVAAVQAAVTTGLEVWVALTAGPDGSLMASGAMTTAAKACADAGAKIVLANCIAAARTLPYVEALASAGVAFGAYANAGSKEDGIGWDADPRHGADRYALLARSWREAGACVVGGCCGTSPSHIERLAHLTS